MNIELVQIFVKVVQSQSFTKASEILKIPKSTASKAVRLLEDQTGTKLLLRTTRSLTLTAAGQAFYDSCLGPIQTIEDAQKSLSGRDTLLVGNIKITAPEDLGNDVVAPAIGELTKKYPGLTFELNYTGAVVDLVKEGFDLAVRIGHLPPSGLKAKKIGEIKLILVASPKYLKTKISKPEELKSHQCLALGETLISKTWILKSNSGTVKVPISPRIVSNQMSSVMKAAISGAGIALVPSFLPKDYLESGKLVRVLPQWTSPGLPVSLLSPLPFSSSARLRMTSDHLLTNVLSAIDFA